MRQAHSAFDWIKEKPCLLDDTGGAATRKIGAQSCMLGVDVITMARGQVYAGSLASTTESYGGCLYRIVDSCSSLHGGDDDAGVMVHVGAFTLLGATGEWSGCYRIVYTTVS